MMNKEDLIKVIVAADKARNDIKAYIKKNGAAPKKRIDSLKAFQQLDGNLDVDGYYGPNSETALKYYLKDMPDSEVPASHKIFADTEITWKKPEIIMPKQEAVAAKPKVSVKKKEKKTQPSLTTKGLGGLANIDLKKRKEEPKKKISNKKESTKKSIEKLTKSPEFGVDEVLSTNNFDAESLLAKTDVISRKIDKTNEAGKDIIKTLKSIKKKVDELKNFDGAAVTKKGNLRLLGLIL